MEMLRQEGAENLPISQYLLAALYLEASVFGGFKV